MTTPLSLLLVFTRYMSLAEWERLGLFERETALYRLLLARGHRVSFLTYGGPGDDELARRLPGLKVYGNRWGLNPKRYERWLPLLHARAFLQADLIKTNQASACYGALAGSRLFRRPLMARMGFLPSDFARREHGVDSADFAREDALERRLCRNAAAIVVPTKALAKDIETRMPQTAGRIAIIPNYVDTDRFFSQPAIVPDVDVLFVGRLTAQKNIAALLEALARADVRAMIVGEGPLDGLVQAAARERPGAIVWQPKVPHAELPALLARAAVFVLPSLWEGHPKVLLEAMACGRPVLGARAPGIEEEIDHGRTGWLADPQPAALAQALRHLLDNPALCANLGTAARAHILETCSLTNIADRECALYQRLQHGVER